MLLISTSTGLWDASGYGSTPLFNTNFEGKIFIPKSDREILRKLAFKVAALAGRDLESEKRKLWYKHNSLKKERPLIFCDPENGWNEIVTKDQLRCTNKLAKKWEIVLRKEIFWGESMKDDKVIEPYFDIGYIFSEDWGVTAKTHRESISGSYIWEPPLKQIEDINKLHYPIIDVDYKKTNDFLELADSVFGDLLKVRIIGVWWWSLGLTYNLALLRGLENMMIDMIDNPQFIHELMKILSDGTLKKLDFLEKNKLLTINNDQYVGSGGFGYSTEIPKEGFDINNIKTKDIWGFCESQETVYVSPEMFEKFVYEYQLPILNRFGLNCYGCCEPLDKRWKIIKKTPNLRRVSVSPWSNFEKMAEILGDNYIYSLKLNPADLACPCIDKENIRKKFRRILDVTKGCILEIIMKDNHTIGNNPNNAIEWVKVIREEIENNS